MPVELQPHQEEAVQKLSNGKVLYGGVGSGKTYTAIAYYLERESDRDVVVITTPRVRDSLDWHEAAAEFLVGEDRDCTIAGTITVDSWNNISKYEGETGKFFIFDEQRLVGSGAWVKSFLKIVKRNNWILLSGTPGDTWMDYSAIFIANGYYRNITEFKRQHVLYAPYSKFPRVIGYAGESRLEILRNHLLVEMPFDRHTVRIPNYLEVDYDKEEFDRAHKRRWNPFTDEPMLNVAELFRVLRQITNEDPSRLREIRKLLAIHPRLIVFYNFDYELEILRTLADTHTVYEWNGHRKHDLPTKREGAWVNLVQYKSGAEGWNCTSTDAIAYYSMTYSYKQFEQTQGRIDRLNTPYTNLYYYVLMAPNFLDRAIYRALQDKKKFNERRFVDENPDLRLK